MRTVQLSPPTHVRPMVEVLELRPSFSPPFPRSSNHNRDPWQAQIDGAAYLLLLQKSDATACQSQG